MNAPLISVLMPVYNAEKYLADAIESILAQTFTDFELIIIDDGSTDGSGAVLESAAASDPRVRLIRRPNTGYTIALNEMLALAQGEFIARMDADDIALPDRFDRQVAHLRDHPDCVAVGGHVLTIDADGDPMIPWFMPLSHDDIDTVCINRLYPGIVHPALMARRGALQAVGGYRREYEPCEDLDILLRLAEVGRLANISEFVLKYRRHLSSVSHDRAALQQRIRLAVLADACQRRGRSAPAMDDTKPRSLTAVEHRRDWAWLALRGGHVATARKHAWATFRQQPLSIESWRVVYCALRGH